MGDTKGGSGPDTRRNPEGVLNGTKNLLRALALFLEQQRVDSSGQGAAQALKGMVNQVGKFDGKNITKFLRTYMCEIELHQVVEARMMESFELAIVPEI
jgi:hypothetical protein